ncbi:zinc ABC transporter substrate-binding protein [Thioclava nitratireducens]|uniref:High-affinity zinc uptake system protein ZnuA n=1 Tax=Thioclava nitratireducens TaxID=1915078 RepID=A0ABN4XDE5_9RHOB|nr:zinc ABC transporter substrate-binding protein [Thioclava nitratireducens]AQS47611.1 zinc ABC transporter substrate-binding protein [Thioclava nitratireducens]
MRPTLPVLVSALAALPALAQAEAPSVVTDVPPVQSLVAQVMGDLGQPEVLLGQNSDAHHYQLKPSQARDLQDADLVFWVGPRLTPWLERAIDGVGVKGQSVELLHAPGTTLRSFSVPDPHDHSVDADADHAEAGNGDHAEVDQMTDPHAWLDPDNAKLWLGLIAEDLSKADPEHAETYAANSEATQARIEALDAKLKAEFAPVADKPFLVYHAAYGYLADHYGLTIMGALSPSDASTPGAAHLVSLREEASAKEAVCAFPEANHDPKMVEVLVDGTPVRLGKSLDPSGTALTYGPGLYEDLMQGMADTIIACLSQG